MATVEYDTSTLAACGRGGFISVNVDIRRPHLVEIGDRTNIDSGFYCTTQLRLGDYIHIAPYVSVIGGAKGILEMAHFSTLAAGSRIVCASDDHLGAGLVGPTIPEEFKDNITYSPVRFEPMANVGTNVVILPGVTLGIGSVVGACSLVTKSVEPWTIYAGIPAKPVKSREREKMLEFARRLGYEF
jgi:acetyltransferase-like isoleucine patch superfamily enzyme